MNIASGQSKNLASSATDNSGIFTTTNNMRNFTLEPYPMNVPGQKRGLALIFSHSKFLTEELPRKAAEVDNDRLTSLLESFGFQVMLCRNYRKQEIFHKLLEVSQINHRNHECLAIFVMTHGMLGELVAYDYSYKVHDLWSYFTELNCPTLSGKPKLFFIQACRGKNTDAGIYMQSKSSNYIQQSSSSSTSVPDINLNFMHNPNKSEMPNEPDFLVAHSTIPGYYAYTGELTGSWFIQEFCNILEKYGRKYDLLTLLTFVAQNVAIDHESNCLFKPANDKKQMSCTMSTLQRPLYFFPGEAEKNPEESKILL